MNLLGSVQRGIDDNILPPVEIGGSESKAYEFFHRVAFTRGHNIIVRVFLLQHPPHGVNVFSSVPPIPLSLQVAEIELRLCTPENLRDSRCYLACYEFITPARRFVIKQNSTAGMEAVRLPIISSQFVARDLADPVQRAWPEPGAFILRRLFGCSKHFARTSEVESAMRRQAFDCRQQMMCAVDIN